VNDAQAAYQDALLHGTPTQIAVAANNLQAAQANYAIVYAAAMKSIADAQAKIAAPQATLDQMLASPDQDNIKLKQLQLTIAQSNLTKAQATLATTLAGADPTDVFQKQMQLTIAQSNLAKAMATLATEQAGADPTDVSQKQQQLTIAQGSLDKAKTTLATEQAGADTTTVQLRQLDVDNAQAALDLAQAQAKMNTLVATASGIITAVNIKVGQNVSASTDAVDMVDPSVYALTASVSELDIALVKVDQKAAISVDAFSGQQISGKVGSIARTASTQQGVVSYRVTVLVIPPAGVQLMVGMSASASVAVQQDNHVLTVPNEAVGGTTSNPTVTVLVSGQAEVRSVKTGLSDDNYTEITGGLQEGDEVLVAPTGNTTQKVTTKSTQTAAAATQTIITQPPPAVTTNIPGGTVPTGFITGGPPRA
jgi:RND family efflux transporter MFP subunit